MYCLLNMHEFLLFLKWFILTTLNLTQYFYVITITSLANICKYDKIKKNKLEVAIWAF